MSTRPEPVTEGAAVNRYLRVRDIEAAGIGVPNIGYGLKQSVELTVFVVAFIAGMILGAAANRARAAEPITGTARVVDGDTIEIGGQRVRLHGIDAPEPGQTCMGPRGGSWLCGSDASGLLFSLTDGKTVTCLPKAANDKYGRVIASCTVAALDLGATMVCRGLAWSYREYAHDYDTHEDDAKNRKAGIWRAVTTPAWQYRHEAWDKAVTEAPHGKPIVGVKSGGGCIYHTPWSGYYRRLNLTKTSNKQFFADENAAQAAGCRQAKLTRAFGWKPRVSRAALGVPPVAGAPCP